MKEFKLEKDNSNQSLLGKYFDLLNEFYSNEYTLYRGQSRITYEPKGNEYLEPLPSLLRSGKRTPMKYLNTMESDYLQEQLGLTKKDIPDWAKLNSNDLISLEDKLVSHFDELSMKIKDSDFESKLDKLVTMQHCGIPTRLLDWSQNPLKGLFFAVDKVNNHDKDGVVYVCMYNKEEVYSRKDIKEILESPKRKLEQINPIYPEPNHPRVLAQESCFTIFPLDTDSDLPSIQQENKSIKKTVKIRIPSKHKSFLRNALRLLGIDYFTLSPDLDGIGTEINRFFERFNLD